MSEPAPIARFTVSFQGKTLSIWELPKGATRIIGRGSDVHYQIKTGILSRKHCIIKDSGQAIEIEDLDSLNGVMVNQEKVKKCKLDNGDEVHLGPILMRVETSYPRSKQNRRKLTTEIRKKEIPYEEKFYCNTVFKKQWPTGNCAYCDIEITDKEFSSQQAVFSGDLIYCMPCICKGAGNFPVIGGYRIIKKIGVGGMGEVYEAVQMSMERPVAFKLMKVLQGAQTNELRRFLREARIGGKLTHPNVVGFIDAGEFDGVHYITMEYIEGMDVKQILKEKGALSYSQTLRIGYYLANALDYASSRYQIVHRDIKPGNILVDYNNVVKLTDFGLSKNLEGLGLSAITRPKTGVGTVYYMAPEQIDNACHADHRVDIYALAVTMYEMMTAKRPFEGDKIVTVVNKIRNEAPTPVHKLNPAVPENIWPILAKAMEKKIENRFKEIGEMKEQLHQALKSMGYEFR